MVDKTAWLNVGVLACVAKRAISSVINGSVEIEDTPLKVDGFVANVLLGCSIVFFSEVGSLFPALESSFSNRELLPSRGEVCFNARLSLKSVSSRGTVSSSAFRLIFGDIGLSSIISTCSIIVSSSVTVVSVVVVVGVVMPFMSISSGYPTISS